MLWKDSLTSCLTKLLYHFIRIKRDFLAIRAVTSWLSQLRSRNKVNEIVSLEHFVKKPILELIAIKILANPTSARPAVSHSLLNSTPLLLHPGLIYASHSLPLSDTIAHLHKNKTVGSRTGLNWFTVRIFWNLEQYNYYCNTLTYGWCKSY